MNKAKKDLLEKTYQQFMHMGFNELDPSILKDIADKSVMGFGTTFDEKIFSLNEMEELLKRQHAQSEGVKMTWNSQPQYRHISEDENTGVYADDLFLHVQVENETLEMYIRFSLVLEYKNEKWLMVHWHASKPEEVESEKDTFGIDTWKEKAEALEKIVGERTADLVVKNRELKIEAALERVRARTMAMQHSDELADASLLLDSQIRALGIKTRGCAFNIYGEKDSTEWFSSEMGTMPTYKTPRENVFLTYYEVGKTGAPIYVKEFTGEACTAHYNYLCTLPVMGDGLKEMIKSGGAFPTQQIDHVTYFKYGYLLFITLEPMPEAHDIFIRFAKVFEQTYTRFLDLQKAEVQARESQIEAALERVRSRTMAMQSSNELAETSAILFRQLIHLGIAPNRLYIGIANDKNTDIEFWITDEDGSKVSTMFSGDADKNSSIKKMYDGWKQKKTSIIIDMHGKELDDYFHYLGEELSVPFQGGLAQKRRIQYLSYFAKGFIGMASPEEQPEETLILLQRFAAVFNLTFTRFNDLKVAEAHALQAEHDLIEIKAARKKAEETLLELQSTQKQLIQSEKMASLGELTAGIAHEIQNPLNFVNNFSEINQEMIDEMKNELANGNNQQAIEIANDIKENEEKINHHGKRADAIVKGMLQHSRSSTGKKEPTDINALADEYFRLAYHGLRAKDKSFNAKLETDFDDSIGEINMVPQDMGRVILNLITNAFYAVDENKKSGGENYEPTVKVSTKNLNDAILVSVKDNGNGMPTEIIDKIFQPFFTTKPTGKGTGLGLSMSYDIVTKGHNGHLNVETKLGEGTTFIIKIPKNNTP